MSTKESGLIDVGYPIYGAKFVNNKTLIVTGGGGEGNNGIPNKITAIKCSLKVSDKSKRLQKFREIVLPKNEDSPMCLDIAKDSVDNEDNFSVFVGCNQSTQLLKSMNINNNLRKYVFTSEEHLRFVDAAQLEEDISGEGVGEYPKIVCLSSHNSVGCLMTSRNPSVIYIFNPDLLELNFKFKPERDIDILDFHLSPGDDGKTLCYITASSIETVSTVTGNTISSTNAISNKALAKYNLSKVRFIDDANIILTASLKNGKGVSIFQYSVPDKKIIKQRDVSTKIKGVTAMDISLSQGLVALAGNDTSITVLRLADFKTIKTFTKLHSFAITRVAFSPSGSKLASVSAANTLHVMKIPSNYSNGRSIIGTLVHYIFMAVIACLVAVFLQKFYENGQLEQFYELSGHYSQVGFKLANEYGVAGYQFVKEKIRGENVDGDDTTKQYFKMDEWDEKESSQSTHLSFTNPVETYSSETTEVASTIIQTGSSNDNIDIRDITKDIDEITRGNSIKTETFFNDTNNYIEQSTIINAPNSSMESVIVSTTIETTELKAAQTDDMTKDKTEIVSNVATEHASILTENPDERIQNNDTREDKHTAENLMTDTANITEDEEITTSEVEPEVVIGSDTEEAVNDDAETYSEEEGFDGTEEEAVDENEPNVEEEAVDNVEADVEEEDVDDLEADVEEEDVDEEGVETEVLDIKDEVHPAGSRDIVTDAKEEQESYEGEHDVNYDVIDENTISESEASESDLADYVDSAETLEPEQIARETDSSVYEEVEPVEDAINDAEEFESLNPDQVNDASDDLDNNIDDAIDSIDDSRPADTPIIENSMEEEAESEIDDSRPADLPRVDNFDERDIDSDTEGIPDSHIVDDSTFDHNEVSALVKTSSSDHEIDSNESTSQRSTTFTKHQSISSSEQSIVTEPFTSKPANTKSSRNKVTTVKPPVTESPTTKASTIDPATINPTTRSIASRASSKSLSSRPEAKKLKSSEVTTPASAEKTTVRAPQKTVLSDKKSSITSVPQSNIKNATRTSTKKTRIPKKSLSKRLTKIRTVKPKTTSQLHDEL